MIPLTLDSILEGILDDDRDWAPDGSNSTDNDGTGIDSPLSPISPTLSPNAQDEVSLPLLISPLVGTDGLMSVNPRLLNSNFVSGTLDPSASCLNLNLTLEDPLVSPLLHKQMTGSPLCMSSPLFVSTSSTTNSPYSSSSTEPVSPMNDLKSDLPSPECYDLTLDSKTGILSNNRTFEKLPLDMVCV